MKIMLCCAVGMSSSLLVRKMKKCAEEQGRDHKIWAVPNDIVFKDIHKADVLLLGPHMRYLLPDLQKLGQEKGVPVDIINPVHYGRFDGAEVLKAAEQLLNQSK